MEERDLLLGFAPILNSPSSLWYFVLDFEWINPVVQNSQLRHWIRNKKYLFTFKGAQIISHSNCRTLCEKCPNKEFFLVRIQSECGKIRIRKNSVFGHFSRSGTLSVVMMSFRKYCRKYFRPVEEGGWSSSYCKLRETSCFWILSVSVFRTELMARLKGGRNPKTQQLPKIHISWTAGRRKL